MSDTSARLGLPYMAAAQAQKHVTHNEALLRLDALTQLVLESVDATTPPETPEAGTVYAVGSTPTGVWATAAEQLAYWDGTAWIFVEPQIGWQCWDKAAGLLRVYQGATWDVQQPNLQNLSGVGIGATSDAVNRLSISAEATLLSHSGAGHQLKINKAAQGDTASLLYQSGWVGHAEMGLAGNTDFNVKVSPDGITWHEAFVVEAATGRVQFPQEAIPAPPRAYVSTVTSQTVQSGIDTYLNFETSVYDTAGFYNPVNPDRLTVPEDGGYELGTFAQIVGGFAVGEGWIIIERYNASGTRIGSFPASWVTGFTALSSPMIACQEDDYFRLLVRQNSGSDKDLLVSDDRNYLSIKRVF